VLQERGVWRFRHLPVGGHQVAVPVDHCYVTGHSRRDDSGPARDRSIGLPMDERGSCVGTHR
ncbi:hypothetical protein P0E77_14335, partial [Enterococcus faecalis]|uniref:hypothetical protein n=1 Tax=Enterococcus faecalis TaxID=1351 RepID=UPI0025B1A90E